MESVLIIGGTGFIGANLAQALAVHDHRVQVLSRTRRHALLEALPAETQKKIEPVAGDPSDFQTLQELVRHATIVFHKATSIGLSGAVESAHDYVGANISSTANLVDVLRAPGHKVKQVVLGSSVSVYGEGNYNCTNCGIVRPQIRTSESLAAIGNGWEPPCPQCAGIIQPLPTEETAHRQGESIYAVTKKTQEDLLTGACRQAGIKLTIMRYATVLGAGQSWHNPFTRVLEQLATGESPIIHEDGRQTRDFIFVDDVIRANLAALQREQSKLIEKYNIAGVHMPLAPVVEQFSQCVAELLGQKQVQPLVDGRLVAGDVRHCLVDCRKARERLGFTAEVPFEEGIKQLVRWFIRFKSLAPLN